IQAVLLDDQGQVIARGEGLGQNGGLNLSQELTPGSYTLRVTAHKFGSESTGGNSYTVAVAGLDDSGQRLTSAESGIDAGSGIRFGGPGRDGRTTAFVDKSDAVAAIAAPQAVVEPAATGQDRASEGNVEASQVDEAAAQPKAFDEIVADIDIRAKGKVLSFDVVEPGTVSVSSSTFVGSETEYRLEARILDAQGNVVASDAADGFEGDFHIKTHLDPGRYTVWVAGQKFGSSGSGVNNYTLRIQQLSTR
ncbi:MAG: hypothetical protein UMU75_02100, partial [Halomonas sp.]|nr:hypothetical protein [Halomonas sp.]